MNMEFTYEDGKKITIKKTVGWEQDALRFYFKLNNGKEIWIKREGVVRVNFIDTRFKEGQKVKYIGADYPEYTGEIYYIGEFMAGRRYVTLTAIKNNIDTVALVVSPDELEAEE